MTLLINDIEIFKARVSTINWIGWLVAFIISFSLIIIGLLLSNRLTLFLAIFVTIYLCVSRWKGTPQKYFIGKEQIIVQYLWPIKGKVIYYRNIQKTHVINWPLDRRKRIVIEQKNSPPPVILDPVKLEDCHAALVRAINKYSEKI